MAVEEGTPRNKDDENDDGGSSENAFMEIRLERRSTRSRAILTVYYQVKLSLNPNASSGPVRWWYDRWYDGDELVEMVRIIRRN